MSTVRLTDVIVPDVFTDYVVQNSFEKNALFLSGVVQRNNAIEEQLRAGSHSFTVPFWNDLGDDEADLVSDDPDSHSTPKKVGSGKQVVRKSFLHQSWSAMNLASELAGSDAMARIQSRAAAYWDRQLQRRLIASLEGVLAANVADDSGDMLLDVTGLSGGAEKFGPEAVIDSAASMGDNLGTLGAIAMHSDIYRAALKADLIETIQDSQGRPFRAYRGLVVVVDDALPRENVADPQDPEDWEYVSILFGNGALGYGLTEPRISDGTEIENIPSAGDGGGQQVLHSRINTAVHPAGFRWLEDSVAGESPSIAELALAGNWERVVDRRAVPLAFLKSKL